MSDNVITTAVVGSALCLFICIIWAELRLIIKGVPTSQRIISLNGFKSFANIFFYTGEWRKIRDVDIAFQIARISTVIFFASFAASFFLRNGNQ